MPISYRVKKSNKDRLAFFERWWKEGMEYHLKNPDRTDHIKTFRLEDGSFLEGAYLTDRTDREDCVDFEISFRCRAGVTEDEKTREESYEVWATQGQGGTCVESFGTLEEAVAFGRSGRGRRFLRDQTSERRLVSLGGYLSSLSAFPEGLLQGRESRLLSLYRRERGPRSNAEPERVQRPQGVEEGGGQS